MTDHSEPVVEAFIDHLFGPGGAPALNADQTKRVMGLREGFRFLARHLAHACPNSFEREQALLALDSALSWASKSICRAE